jgi:hypothetical protein
MCPVLLDPRSVGETESQYAQAVSIDLSPGLAGARDIVQDLCFSSNCPIPYAGLSDLNLIVVTNRLDHHCAVSHAGPSSSIETLQRGGAEAANAKASRSLTSRLLPHHATTALAIERASNATSSYKNQI